MYREIEHKFRVSNWTDIDALGAVICEILNLDNRTYTYLPFCKTKDQYWLPPADSEVQFARVRDSIGETSLGEYQMLKEITVKAKDRGNNLNRLEINVKVDSATKAAAMLSVLTANMSCKTIVKDAEQIWFIPVTGGEVVLSTCKIGNDRTLFLEVEGPSEEIVTMYCQALSEVLDLKLEPRSFFEIYVQEAA